MWVGSLIFYFIFKYSLRTFGPISGYMVTPLTIVGGVVDDEVTGALYKTIREE